MNNATTVLLTSSEQFLSSCNNYKQWTSEDLDILQQSCQCDIRGRLLAKRMLGKIGFAHLLDQHGKVQLVFKKEVLSEQCFSLWKSLSMGDVIGISGYPMVTSSGELSICVTNLTLFAKNLNPMPDKWSGISDSETRQRQRYADLFVNHDIRTTFRRRSQIINIIRQNLISDDFMEVETPMMQSIPGGASARPFITHHNALDEDFYLRIAPELYLKRLIVGGFERVFEIGKNFRNEGIDHTHNPEFTSIEFYEAYATYHEHIGRITGLIKSLVESFQIDNGIVKISDGDFVQEISLLNISISKMEELIILHTELSADKIRDVSYLSTFIREHTSNDIQLPQTFGKLWEIIFSKFVEHKLVDPTFVTHLPIEISPLALRDDNDPEIASRFELYIGGKEIANGFNELNNADEQLQRFQEQALLRGNGDDEAMFIDDDYINALRYGMPPTAGCGIGIDRLVMLFTQSSSIRDVILFPTLRREKN